MGKNQCDMDHVLFIFSIDLSESRQAGISIISFQIKDSLEHDNDFYPIKA